MSEDERYQGWTNRETWMVSLWLSNDQGLYDMTNERLREALDNYTPEFDFSSQTYTDTMAGDAIESLVEELLDPDEQLLTKEDIITALSDIGSMWRVNWQEVGANWLSGLDDA